MDKKIQFSAYTVTTAVGKGREAHAQALAADRGGLRECDFDGVDLRTWIGRVEGVEDAVIDGALREFDCRNNRLAFLGLEQDNFRARVGDAIRRYGADRVGIFLGTSTSGVQQTELAYARRAESNGELPSWYNYHTTQNMYSVARFCRKLLGLQGPAQVTSTACSSSAKAICSAYRYMQLGLCDAAVVGGVDSLCQMTLYGFHSLQLVSEYPCRPADVARDGINIGEAAGFALMEWAGTDNEICLLGYGESSDAYHMSRPHPEGAGALISMERALDNAGLKPEDIDYINLHGTATPANDLSEDRGLFQLFNGKTPCSSTKGLTGHTLGAAGIVEAVFSCLAVENGLLPASHNTTEVDAQIRSPIVLKPVRKPVARVLSNSFGFGGSNASLVIGHMGR